jgi:hypothetical protein
LVDDQALGRKEPNMMIIGVDYHPSFQQIAFFVVNDDSTTAKEKRRISIEI